MMESPEMMGMMMNEPEVMMDTMDHMANMTAKDSIMINSMVQMMKERPEMWSEVMKMKNSTTKTNDHHAR